MTINNQSERTAPDVILNHKMKNRILILTKPTEEILTQIEQSTAGFSERKLIVIDILNAKQGTIAKRQLSNKKLKKILGWLNIQEVSPLVTLIGLDSEIKYQEKLQEWDLNIIFEKIDQMPMRQSEMNTDS